MSNNYKGLLSLNLGFLISSQLIKEIKRCGYQTHQNQTAVTFGELFDELSDEFEALSGTLRMAKKRKVRAYFSACV